ncbi:MAG TPA: hypothetical protein VNZ54_03225 [bacterium]|nr:hypothetical protein [bacterium]
MRAAALGLLLALGPWAAAAAAQSDLGGAGMAGSWLGLPNDARLAGMGYAGAGAALGLDSLGVNPAGLAAQAAPALGMTYDQWVEDVSTQHLAAALPLAGGVAGVSLDYLNGGTVETVAPAAGPGQFAQVTGSLQPWAMDVALAWAQTVGRLRAGGQLELVSEQWGSGPGQAAPAAGLGVQEDGPGGLGLGAGLSHLGVLGGHALPSEAHAGLAWAPDGEWRLFADGRAPLADLGGWNTVLAAEWQLRGNLAARAGWVGAGQDNSGGLCLGFSVRWQFLDFDYAYESGGPLGSSQQLGLTLAFSDGAAEDGNACAAPPLFQGQPPAGPAERPLSPSTGAALAPVLAAAAPLSGPAEVSLATPGPNPTAGPAPNLGDLLEQRLRAALAGKDDAALLANLERLRVREPSRARRWAHGFGPALARAALADGQSERGYSLLRSALHAAGEDPVLLAALVQFCANQGRRAEAALYAQRALSVDPGLQPSLAPWLKP